MWGWLKLGTEVGLGAAGIIQGVESPQKAHQKQAALPGIPRPLSVPEEAREVRRVAAGCPPASAHPECAATCC